MREIATLKARESEFCGENLREKKVIKYKMMMAETYIEGKGERKKDSQ